MLQTTRGLHKVSTSVGWMSLNHLAIMILRLCYVLVAARMLDAADYGVMAYSQSWYTAVLPLVLLSVSILFGREIGADRAGGLQFASATRRPRLLITLAATLLLGAAAVALEPVPENVALIVIFALTLAPRAMAVGSQCVLTGLECARQTFANNLVWRTSELLVATGALVAGAGILTLALIHVASWSLQSLNGLARERRAAGSAQSVDVIGDAGWTRTLFHDGLPLALGAFVTGLLGSGILILFRADHGAGDMLGAVALFIQATGVILGFSVAVGNALLPYLARTASIGRDHHAPLLRLAMSFSLIAGVAATVFLLLISGPWVTRLFGTGFADLSRWLPGLGLFVTPILWYILASRLFVSHASVRRLLPITICGAGAALAAAPFLIQALGGTGALAAALLGYLLQGAFASWVTAGIVSVRRRYILAQLAAFLVLTVLAGGAIAGVVRPATAIPALTLLALLASGGAMAEVARTRRRR